MTTTKAFYPFCAEEIIDQHYHWARCHRTMGKQSRQYLEESRTMLNKIIKQTAPKKEIKGTLWSPQQKEKRKAALNDFRSDNRDKRLFLLRKWILKQKEFTVDDVEIWMETNNYGDQQRTTTVKDIREIMKGERGITVIRPLNGANTYTVRQEEPEE